MVFIPGSSGSQLVIEPTPGTSVEVNITGGLVTSDTLGQVPVTFPQTITSNTTYYSPQTAVLAVSCLMDGDETADGAGRPYTWVARDGAVAVITPALSVQQIQAITAQLSATYDSPAHEKALAEARSAFAQAATTPVDVFVLGHSIAEGEGASSLTTRWVNKMLDDLRKEYQPAGVTGGVGFIPAYWSQFSFTDPGYAVSGSTVDISSGPGARCLQMHQNSTRTFQVTGTSIDVCYMAGNAAGTCTVQVDGSVVDTIDTSAVTLQPFVKHRVSLGTAGSHTVIITATSTNDVFFQGIMVYDGDESAGVRLWDGSHYGWRTVDFLGNMLENPAFGDVFTPIFSGISPQLVIVQLTPGNDFLEGNVTPDTTSSSLQSLIGAIHAGSPQSSILLLQDYSLGTGANAAGYHEDDYRAAAVALAGADLRLAPFDLKKYVPSDAEIPLNGYADGTHPTDKFHALIGHLAAAVAIP